jgi:hypothetical protein
VRALSRPFFSPLVVLRASRLVESALVALAVVLSAGSASAQCDGAGHAETFEQRYGDALGPAAGAGFAVAAVGALIGLAVPALFCSAGVGDDGCEAAWVGGVGGGAAVGLLLGVMLGTSLGMDDAGDEGLAAGGFGVLAGGLLVAAGVGLSELTEEPAFLYGGLAGWALAVLFVTPLFAIVLQGSPDCAAPAPSPLAFRFDL